MKRNAVRFASWEVTCKVGGLHGRRTWCELLLDHELRFIMTCKMDSHQALYEEVELLTRVGDAVQTMTVQHWNGRFHERWEYRWDSHVPIRTGAKALCVNWCEVTVVRDYTGKRLYHDVWITSQALTQESVP